MTGELRFRYHQRPDGTVHVWLQVATQPEFGPVELRPEQGEELGRLLERAVTVIEEAVGERERAERGRGSIP